MNDLAKQLFQGKNTQKRYLGRHEGVLGMALAGKNCVPQPASNMPLGAMQMKKSHI